MSIIIHPFISDQRFNWYRRGGALKNAFFRIMDNNEEIFDIKSALILSAQSYFKLLRVEIVISSHDLIIKEVYRLRFFKENFLHLTGVNTDLKKKDFFDKCLIGTINENDYKFGPYNDRKTVKRKLKQLLNVGNFFDAAIFVQENFVKNKIICNIATCDGKCTIGFVDNKVYLRPKTILTNNHLDQNKPIYLIKPKKHKL